MKRYQRSQKFITNKMTINLYMFIKFVLDRISSYVYSSLTITKDFSGGLKKKLKILKQ